MPRLATEKNKLTAFFAADNGISIGTVKRLGGVERLLSMQPHALTLILNEARRTKDTLRSDNATSPCNTHR